MNHDKDFAWRSVLYLLGKCYRATKDEELRQYIKQQYLNILHTRT